MEPTATTFRYERPELRRSKAFVKFFRTDLMSAEVQVIGQGGENNLHTHQASDGFWMVLEGQARFYGEGDVIVAELGPLGESTSHAASRTGSRAPGPARSRSSTWRPRCSATRAPTVSTSRSAS